jgi:esterase/lipase superfamily enzyme
MSQIEYLSPATRQMKQTWTWYSARLKCETTMVRWGHFGVPLLLFPTAGGDAEEVERFFLVKTLEPFIHDGRIKVYSVDSVAGRTWLTNNSVAHCVWIQKQFDEYLVHEAVPNIYRDCQTEGLEMLVAGASIGAFNSLLAICRHPQIFRSAVCMSGTYDIAKWLQGQWFDEFHHLSPLHFVPHLPDDQKTSRLRERFIVLPTGQGAHEDPGESWRVAHVLGQKQIPNRVDLWDASWPHDWVTWRRMLPQYIDEMLEKTR